MRRQFTYGLLWLLLLAPALLHAQWTQYSRYTREDGLPTNYVYGVLEDDDGIIWAYTEEGVARFNGKTFEVFNAENGLPTNDVFLLEKDQDGRLFPGCFNCPAFYYEDGQWVIPPTDKQAFPYLLPKYDLQGMLGLIGRVKLSTFPSVINYSENWFELENGWKKRIYQQNSTRKEVFYGIFNFDAVIQVRSDSAFFCTKQDTVFIRAKNWPIRPMIFSSFQNFYNPKSQVLSHHDDSLFLLTQLFGSKSLAYPQPFDKTIAPFCIQGIFPNGNNYFTWPSGFWEFDAQLQKVDSLDTRDLNVSAILTRPYKDKHGNLWLGSKDSGLLFFRKMDQGHAHLSTGEEQDNPVRFFLQITPDTIVAVTDNGALFEINYTGKNFHLLNKFNHTGRLRYLNAWSWKGEQWWILGQQQGIRFLNIARNEIRKNIDPEGPSTQEELYTSARNHFISKNGQISYIHTLNSLTKVDHASNAKKILYEDAPYDVKLDPFDRLYFIGMDGIYLVAPHTDTPQIVAPLEFPGRYRLTLSPKGTLWLYTLQGEFFYFENQELIKLQGFRQLANTLFWEHEHSLWIGTSRGIHHLQFSPHHWQRYQQDHYTGAHGLSSENILSVFVNQDHILAGSHKGLDLLSRSVQQAVHKLQPELHIRKVVYGSENMPLSPGTIIPFQENKLLVLAELISYESKGNFHFAYRLSESDTLWETSSNGQILLRNLPAGSYTLQIKGIDAFGNESEVFESRFNVLPIWYMQGRYIFLLILGVAGLAFLVSWFSSRRMIRQATRRQEMETQIHKLRLRAFRSQMNPHFIFNALGSIQYYIQTKEVEKADEYLSDFASLVRLILESSQQEMIQFQDEVKLLRLYIGLEHVRFEQRFDYTFEVDPEIDPDFKLPAMIIQPFVENAINHGLYHLTDRAGKLIVQFTAEGENGLLGIIEDNGIGRKAATALRTKNHRSRSMELIQEQLATLQRQKNLQVNMETIDLFEEGKPTGTRVLIKMNYL